MDQKGPLPQFPHVPVHGRPSMNAEDLNRATLPRDRLGPHGSGYHPGGNKWQLWGK